MTWNDIKYFTPDEFDSPDAPGSGLLKMDLAFVAKLDSIREACDFPFKITSGYRTLAHNKAVGGKSGSAHMKGHAADIAAATSQKRFTIVKTAMEHGIRRIGIANGFVHLDDLEVNAQDVIWTYDP